MRYCGMSPIDTLLVSKKLSFGNLGRKAEAIWTEVVGSIWVQVRLPMDSDKQHRSLAFVAKDSPVARIDSDRARRRAGGPFTPTRFLLGS
jgi:hypothetical protein